MFTSAKGNKLIKIGAGVAIGTSIFLGIGYIFHYKQTFKSMLEHVFDTTTTTKLAALPEFKAWIWVLIAIVPILAFGGFLLYCCKKNKSVNEENDDEEEEDNKNMSNLTSNRGVPKRKSSLVRRKRRTKEKKIRKIPGSYAPTPVPSSISPAYSSSRSSMFGTSTGISSSVFTTSMGNRTTSFHLGSGTSTQSNTPVVIKDEKIKRKPTKILEQTQTLQTQTKHSAGNPPLVDSGVKLSKPGCKPKVSPQTKKTSKPVSPQKQTWNQSNVDQT